MGGNSDKTREGRTNEGKGGGDVGPGNSQGGTLGRDQQPKQSNVLLKDGKVQPGTMAYRNKK